MKKYTFTEMVICTVCIALLAVTGISALNATGNAKAEEALCADQQRHIFAAISKYANDNAGFIPYWDDEASIPGCKTRVTWAYKIRKYLPEETGNRNYFCPTQQKSYPDDGTSVASRSNMNSQNNCVARPERNLEFYRSINYGINFEYAASNIGGWAGPNRKDYITMNFANIVNPAEKVLVSDAWNGTSGRFIIASYNSGSNKMNPCHENGTNVLWSDGHVARVDDPHNTLQNGKLTRQHFRMDK